MTIEREIQIWELILQKAPNFYNTDDSRGICYWMYIIWKTKKIDDGEYDELRRRFENYGREQKVYQVTGYWWALFEFKKRTEFISNIIQNLRNEKEL